jgi:hypothetical protein
MTEITAGTTVRLATMDLDGKDRPTTEDMGTEIRRKVKEILTHTRQRSDKTTRPHRLIARMMVRFQETNDL